MILSSLSGQDHNSNWYLGHGIGLNINDDNTSVSYDYIPELCFGTSQAIATYSDSSGELVFYFDSQKIINSQHEIVHEISVFSSLSLQGAIIAAHPSNVNWFYVFGNPNSSMRYAVVKTDGKNIIEVSEIMKQKGS